MSKPTKTFYFAFIVFTLFIKAGVVHAKTISVPLNIYIVEDLPITVKQQALPNWITQNDLRNIVLPEVNRIWSRANLQFTIRSISVIHIKPQKEMENLIHKISAATRDTSGKSDPSRIKALNSLVNPEPAKAGSISIIIVPFLGENSQGNAKPKKRRLYVAQWTNKNQSNGLPPRKFELLEARPYRKGSFSRTLAHELGHILGLKHPNKNTQTTFQRLMGGKRKGYQLTNGEIETARDTAEKILYAR